MMKARKDEIFIALFKEVYTKCFGHDLTSPLSETESKHLCNKVFEETGLVIGVKSVKNYSVYVLNGAEAKKENPSVATLDTLARYVLGAPYTDEVARKDNESHFPYWFQYKGKFSVASTGGARVGRRERIAAGVVVLVMMLVWVVWLYKGVFVSVPAQVFRDGFFSVREDSLGVRGWRVALKDTAWWNRRGERAGYLTLFTLPGDNWPDSTHGAGIRNLLIRNVSSECFSTEVHFDGFVPRHNWQQAGILLLEDTLVNSRSIRLSISYNDFFGGYVKAPEIIIQAVSSSESGSLSKLEEIAHVPIFTIGDGEDDLVRSNLKRSALKIEKSGKHFRLLYCSGPIENFAFKEVVSGDFNLKPKYIALFAIQGFVSYVPYERACIDYFGFNGIACAR